MTECSHQWVRVDVGSAVVRYVKNDKRKKGIYPQFEYWCLVCKQKRAPEKRVVRLRVLNRQVDCAYGFGTRNLHDCYLDSITPGHRCVDPLGTGETRCPQIKRFRERFGLRTWYKTLEVDHTRHGASHAVYPLRILYVALDSAGQRWMAVNQITGQRVAVALDGTGQQWSRDADGRWSVLMRGPTRRTLEGAPIEQDTRHTSYTTGKPVVTMPYWNGVAPREEMPPCACAACRDQARTLPRSLTATEFYRETGFRIPGATVVEEANTPTIKPIGDPQTCTACRYARCHEHRMIFLPKTDVNGVRIIAHAGDFRHGKPSSPVQTTAAKLPEPTEQKIVPLTKTELLNSRMKGEKKKWRKKK